MVTIATENMSMSTSYSDITVSPEAWGWKADLAAAWAEAVAAKGGEGLAPARVVARERGLYDLACPDFSDRRPVGPRESAPSAFAGLAEGVPLSGRFGREASEASDMPATGDWVLVDELEDRPRIRGLLSRRSAVSRARAGGRSEEQVLAANVDTLLIVLSLDGERGFLPRFLERAMAAARASGAAACVVLNKADLASPSDRDRALAEAYRTAPGCPVVALSARTGEGMDELAAFLSLGETVGMLGKSGAGKSSLLNALGDGALGDGARGAGALAREGAVREGDGRGRHTTTSSRLYRLDSGILVIDGPGIRELAVWCDEGALAEAFPEIAELAARCRFSDCAHRGEPGCAVAEALESGELEEERYASYLSLERERAWLATKVDERARRAVESRWKQIAKAQKRVAKERERG